MIFSITGHGFDPDSFFNFSSSATKRRCSTLRGIPNRSNMTEGIIVKEGGIFTPNPHPINSSRNGFQKSSGSFICDRETPKTRVYCRQSIKIIQFGCIQSFERLHVLPKTLRLPHRLSYLCRYLPSYPIG